MRPAVLVAIALSGCGFQANPAPGGGATSDGQTDTPPPIPDAPAIDAMIDAPIDAAIDAPPDAPPVWTTVDTLMVSCLGMTVSSTFVLQTGVMYKLLASGECYTNTENNSRGDAEYFGYNVGPTYNTYAGIDSGIAVNDPTPGSSKQPQWGQFSTQHAYEVMWTGSGGTIALKFHSSDYSNNAGSLMVRIQALQ
jgi:hypothetical protein